VPMSIGDVILAKYGCGSDLSRIVDPRGLEATSGWNFLSGWGSGIVIQSRLLQR
jgi:hypothetical protein